jgi:large conductance mechanosensitive channel
MYSIAKGNSSMWKEFRDFIMRGNVVDLAVGIIIGTAFTAIVNSLVKDIIMPPIGVIIGGIDFSSIAITLKAAAGDVPAVTINIGVFLNAVIQFLIIAFAVFMLIRGLNSMTKKKEEAPAAPPAPTTEEKLLEAIKELTVAIKAQK